MHSVSMFVLAMSITALAGVFNLYIASIVFSTSTVVINNGGQKRAQSIQQTHEELRLSLHFCLCKSHLTSFCSFNQFFCTALTKSLTQSSLFLNSSILSCNLILDSQTDSSYLMCQTTREAHHDYHEACMHYFHFADTRP